MTPRERVLTALKHQQPDRVPYDIPGFNREALRLVKEKAGNLDPNAYFKVEKDIEWVCLKDTRLNLKERYFDFHHGLPEGYVYSESGSHREQEEHSAHSFTLDEWGTAFVVGSDTSYDHFVPPQNIVEAKSLKDIEEYPLPDLMSEYRYQHLKEEVKEIKPDVIFFYHSDGYIEPIIPDFIEIGVGVLNPIQPECMDPAKLKKEYGDKLAFWGTIGIQHTLPFGTPDEVKAEVKERIETVGKGGGIYLSPTHNIAPEVPHENLFAFVEAAKEYGGYK